ncbi:proline dehydrogenase [Salmonella enterica subsp. enterica serovar Inverness str. R8-3668]|uniref:Proline dehydrogenase n=1 Tax=Salmonella enterica subsp. enterica serovar Inverness str. R8-3668 TaxID=913075 RepID=G5NBC3_SALET|nr:proline dehydrogenase [Salmonella enterica subsp. enterica serovar Inverness str. R8-3668]
MGTTTMGVKLDDATRERIKMAASRIDRTPHWLIKQAIFSYLDKLENSDTLPELPALFAGAANGYLRCLPARARQMKARSRSRRRMSRISPFWSLPNRFFPNPSLAPPSPPPGAARKPMQCQC